MLSLDASTLFIVSIAVTGLLGTLLVFLWIQDRQVRALGWWGAAYLLGGCAIGFWILRPKIPLLMPTEIAAVLLFTAASMIWGGGRVFHGRKPIWPVMLAGPAIWLVASQFLLDTRDAGGRVALSSVIITTYIVLTAAEMWRERRGPLMPLWRRIGMPAMHGAVFLSPMLVVGLPRGSSVIASDWFTLFAIETLLYVVGTAFILVVLTSERSIMLHKTAAITDPLTGLLNRRGFLEHAQALINTATRKGQFVGVMMFDLDHFKSINDRFGHGVGDDTLQLFGATLQTSVRATDLASRLGGEEFAVIIVGGPEVTVVVGERVRNAFQKAGVEISGRVLNATVSVGAVCDNQPGIGIEALLQRADAALYEAKRNGRNRVLLHGHGSPPPPPEPVPNVLRVAA